MNIKTKFAPGDSVFRLHNNKVQELQIITVEIRVGPSENLVGCPDATTIRYWLKVGGDSADRVVHESLLFTTKAELLASL